MFFMEGAVFWQIRGWRSTPPPCAAFLPTATPFPYNPSPPEERPRLEALQRSDHGPDPDRRSLGLRRIPPAVPPLPRAPARRPVAVPDLLQRHGGVRLSRRLRADQSAPRPNGRSSPSGTDSSNGRSSPASSWPSIISLYALHLPAPGQEAAAMARRRGGGLRRRGGGLVLPGPEGSRPWRPKDRTTPSGSPSSGPRAFSTSSGSAACWPKAGNPPIRDGGGSTPLSPGCFWRAIRCTWPSASGTRRDRFSWS